jgi:hypothetical protein
MSDAHIPVQANGKGGPVTRSEKPGTSGAGESGGGPYPNPHTGKTPQHGMLDHGGQTEIDQKLTPGEPRDNDGSASDAWPKGRTT